MTTFNLKIKNKNFVIVYKKSQCSCGCNIVLETEITEKCILKLGCLNTTNLNILEDFA